MNASVFRLHTRYPHDEVAIKRAADELAKAHKRAELAPAAFDILRRLVRAQNTGDANLLEVLTEEAREILAVAGGSDVR